MIPKECKRLAEVDFPIAVVSRHSAREKSIRHGHPSTLHLWWARRPLAACRAMLLPDPCDPSCPADFKEKARRLLLGVYNQATEAGDEKLRAALLRFIGDFANWDNAAKPRYVEAGRGLVKAVHGEETPLVVDPFAGGGSIPLEALRLGCDAFASDLNPVACLILKVMLNDIPRHGSALADELRKIGAEIKKEAEKELAEYYPLDPDGATPIAYLWARTVKCESPNCGAEIPLVRSFWLCKKASRLRALRYDVKRPKGEPPYVELEVFTPKSEKDVEPGTVTRAKAPCLACARVLAPDRVRARLREQRGGADTTFDAKGNRIGGTRLLALVALTNDKAGRQYRVASDRDYEATWKAQKAVAKLASQKLPNGLSVIPDEPTPAGGGSGASRAFSVQNYGMMRFGDLFTSRQKLAFSRFASFARSSSSSQIAKDVVALCVSRAAARNSSLCMWLSQGDQETVWTTFGRNALPIVWDFAEAAPLSRSTGSLDDSFEVACEAIEQHPRQVRKVGNVQTSDADQSYPLPNEACAIWFTDPPYYDAIPYADLSDFFYVWLKRVLPSDPLFRDPFDATNQLTPKSREAVQDETKRADGRPKDRAWFEETLAKAFTEGRRV